MTTYNTYQEAKIANPNEYIYMNEIGQFQPDTNSVLRTMKCNPADHCMTVEKFLADGYGFVEGDLILDEGYIYLVSDFKTQNNWYEVESANEPDCDDNRRYILRAAALESIPTETPEEKEVLDGIESTGEVEWNGEGLPPVGIECEWIGGGLNHGDWGLVIIHAYHNGFAWIEKLRDNSMHTVGNPAHFRKPETPQQREDRERLENGKAIYDLMCSIELNHDIAGAPNTWGELRDEWQSVYIKLAEEVGYRKEKTHGTN